MISFALRGLQRVAVNSSRILTVPRGVSEPFQRIALSPQSLILSRNSSAAGPLTATHTITHGKQKHEDHVNHWKIERIGAVLMLPLFPMAFLTDNVYANYALILLVGTHVHWGMESIVTDYLRPRVVGKAAHYAGLVVIYLMSFVTFAGLLYLNYTQMPPTKAIKKLWTEV